MLMSYQHLVLFIQLILFETFEQSSIDESYRRIRSSNDNHHHQHHHHLSTGPSVFPRIVSVSLNDYFAIVDCSTSRNVSRNTLDWYFQSSRDRSPRVIWQGGRSNIHRYAAYSPDERKHYLQIKPVYPTDTGVYMCLDQISGSEDRVELVVRDSRSCAASRIYLQETTLVCLVLLIWILSRRTSSESEVT